MLSFGTYLGIIVPERGRRESQKNPPMHVRHVLKRYLPSIKVLLTNVIPYYIELFTLISYLLIPVAIIKTKLLLH